MKSNTVAMLFPGQGAWYPGVLKQAAAAHPQIQRVLAAVDAVALKRLGYTVSDRLWRDAATTETLLAENPEAVQLSIFATSVALYRWLAAEGVQPGLLMGHSFGEIAALVCAGAFTLEQGAEIVCDRTDACRRAAGDGYMAALGTGVAKAETLVAMIGDAATVVAGENGEAQTVLSGTRAGMDRAAAVAKALGIPFFRLNSPYPFHSPLMEPARAEFAKRLQRVQAAAPTVPVFSPILGRYYQAGDRLTECLADHLVRRVRFAAAVQQLATDGVGTVIECGALDALTKLARSAAPGAGLSAVSCLGSAADEAGSLTRAVEALAALGKAPARHAATTVGQSGAIAPAGLTAADADAFWATHGESIRRFVDEQYEAFRSSKPAPAAPVAKASATIVDFPVAAAAAPSGPPPAVQSGPPAASRDAIFQYLASVYAAALEYPEEVFNEEVELEGELGIDSVKQTELLARVSEEYGLPPRPADFRLSNYNTLGKVTDLIMASVADRPAVPFTPAAAVAPLVEVHATVVPAPAAISRSDLFASIVSMYAAALEYPEEVFTPDVALEAELGIDSVKQTELLARLSEEHGLPPRPADFRLSNYDTLRKVTDFVFGAMHDSSPAASREFDEVPVAVLASRPADTRVALQ